VDVSETIEAQLQNGETVLLSAFELEQSGQFIQDIVEVLQGEGTWFPAFDVPTYEGEQGWVEVEPGLYENRGYSGGHAEHRLYYFAYLDRPFGWPDDPRRDYLQDLVANASNPEYASTLAGASAQDLWDAMFTIVRGERFADGLIAMNAEGLTAVANELRRRIVPES
jgi:hypothetical protein